MFPQSSQLQQNRERKAFEVAVPRLSCEILCYAFDTCFSDEQLKEVWNILGFEIQNYMQKLSTLIVPILYYRLVCSVVVHERWGSGSLK